MNTAMLLFSGLFDYNVKSNNYGYLWEELPEDLPKRLVLYNGDHLDPHTPTTEDAGSKVLPYPFRERFVEATHRWYLQFLKGVDAGALREREVEVQGADGAFRDGGTFPASDEDLVLYPSADGGLDREPPAEGIARYRDGGQSADPSSVTFTSDPFPEDTRVSGQLGFDLDFGYSGADTTVAVKILSVPQGAEPDDDDTVTMDGTREAPLLVGYAWYRDFYRDSIPLRGLSTPTGGSPHVGQPDRSQVEFGSLYTDVVIPRGNRLALRFSNSAGGTVAANTGGAIRIHAPGSRVLVPTAPAVTPIDLTPEPAPTGSPAPVPTASASPVPTGAPAPSSAPTASPAPTTEPSVLRAGGEDRIATAIAASRAAGDAAATVLLARADQYADALTGAPLAADLDAPLLLTGSDALDERTLEEIRRLGATEVVLLGGRAALAPAVEDALVGDGRGTRRLAGADRFGTAVEIARELGLNDGVLLAEGASADRTRGWPDALSASALGALDGRPVLLATRDDLPAATAGALTGDVEVTLVGGPAALSSGVEDAVDQRAGVVSRITGEDRYATAALVADAALARGASAAMTTVATGLDWPDGLTASALAGRSGGVLLLVDGEDPDGGAPARTWLRQHADEVDVLRVVGGPAAVSDAVADQLTAAHR